MRISSINYRVFNYQLNTPFVSSKSSVFNRESLLIDIIFDHDLLLTGEAAPLPDFSKETLSDVINNLKDILSELISKEIHSDPFAQFDFINSLCKTPSLNFALQSIFLKYYLYTKNDLLKENKNNKIKVNGLLSLADNKVIQKTNDLLNEGYDTIKFKMGIIEFEFEYGVLNDIYSLFKNRLTIRLDPNCGIPQKLINDYLEKLNKIEFEYIEDPINNLDELKHLNKYSHKIALDSTQFNIMDIMDIHNKYNISTFVLKPTLLGNIGAILKILNDQKYCKINFIISSTFESYYSADVLFYIASFRLNSSHGLDTFRMIRDNNNIFSFNNGYLINNFSINKENFTRSYLDKNIFSLFPNVNNSNSNLCFVSKNEKLKYSELYSSSLTDYTDYNLKGSTQIAIYNSSIIDTAKLLFYIWYINSRPAILDNKLHISKAKETACNFKTNYLISNDDMINFDINNTAIKNHELLLFTSGSTTSPKGVIISLNSIINSATKFNNYFNVSSDDTFLASLPFNHIGGLMIMFRSILAGAKIIIPDSNNYKDIKKSIQDHNIDYISLVPKQLQDLLNDNVDLSKCKAVILGGAKSDERLVRQALHNGIKLYKVYGSTETCSMVTIASPKDLEIDPNTSGRPFHNVELYINTNNVLSNTPNIKGEIIIKTDTLYSSYINTDLNDYPETKNNNFHYSKDYGYLDENGYLIVERRIDDIIISGGENISPDEIREKILELDEINDAIVFGIEDDIWGQIPVVFILSKNQIDIPSVDKYLREKLENFKIPKKYFIIKEIPYNNNGKIDYKKLKTLIK